MNYVNKEPFYGERPRKITKDHWMSMRYDTLPLEDIKDFRPSARHASPDLPVDTRNTNTKTY